MALVVTIVVLLILAGVALNLVLGENGIIEKANEAKRKTLNEQVYSEEQLNTLYAEMINSETGNGVKPDNSGSPTIDSVTIPEAEITDHSFKIYVVANDSKGIEEIAYSNNGGGTWVTGVNKTDTNYIFSEGITANTTYYVRVRVTNVEGKVTYYPSETTNIEVKTKNASGANKPIITQDLTPVVWNESSKTWDKVKETSDWFNYEAATGNEDSKTSRWANAVTPDGSMWVWIPRYAYKITSNYHKGNTSSGGNIDIVFVDKENKDKDGNIYNTNYPTITGDAMDNYVVHPAFVNNTANGGWDAELSGIWVAKFEASSKEGASTALTDELKAAEENVTTKTLQIKPGVVSWRYIQESNIFDVCRNATYLATNASILNSHQMKNTEWGAVAYLTQSKYGRNNHEVTINNSSSYITGSAGNSVSAAIDLGTTNDYTSNQGVLASTTGNVYGIYDMRGGAWEYVAAYLDTDNANLETYSSTLKSAAAKYKNVYSKNPTTDDQPSNYSLATPTNGHFGDAIWETSGSSSSTTNWRGAWFSDYSQFPWTSYPILVRGSDCDDAIISGIFAFSRASATYNYDWGFRSVLTIL